LSLYSAILFNILNIGQAFSNKEDILKFIKEFESKTLVAKEIYNEFSSKGKPVSYFESRNFFHELSGKTIDTFKEFLKEKLNNKEITEEQNKIFYYFLITYASKVANTTSVFGAFLKSTPKYQPLNSSFVEKVLQDLGEIRNLQNKADFYLGDVINNLKQLPKQTIIYLDPPYSTRRYESNYHILNYIADPNFSSKQLKSGSKTGQPKQINNNPFGKKKETEVIFGEMIKEGVKKSDILGISYNTDGLINQYWMEKFCKENNLVLDTKKIKYKRFKSKTKVINTTELEEILWLIKK
jgi:adenine-specific DNA-methyltransferase